VTIGCQTSSDMAIKPAGHHEPSLSFDPINSMEYFKVKRIHDNVASQIVEILTRSV